MLTHITLRKSASFALVAAFWGWLPAPLSAGPIPPMVVTASSPALPVPPPPTTVIRTKYICGNLNPYLTGTHFTVINVLNPYTIASSTRTPWTKEFTIDQPEPPEHVVAPAVKTKTISFALQSLAAMRIDCPDIAMLLQSQIPGLSLSDAQNSIGYAIIQAPCVPISGPVQVSKNPPLFEQNFHCFQPVVHTVYEHLGDRYVNKILFRLSQTVSPQLPGGKPLEIILPAPPTLLGPVSPVPAGLDVEANVRATLSIPSNVQIEILQIALAAQPLSLDVESVTHQ
jgi:hypothetical protein